MDISIAPYYIVVVAIIEAGAGESRALVNEDLRPSNERINTR